MVTDDLEPTIPAAEREPLLALAARLEHERPVPSAAFRSHLHRRLARRRAPAPRPIHLWRLVGAYGGAGTLLLAVAAVGVAGGGPLAA